MSTATRLDAPSGLDQAIVALPFYAQRHADLAARVGRWCAEQHQLWAAGEADSDQLVARRRRIVAELGAAGLLAFLDPGQDSQDGDLRSLCLVREVLAYADDAADYAFSIQALAATPILRHGSPRQREAYLPGMAAGQLCGAFAISEDAAGSDVAAIATTARRTEDGYVLNGAKAWIACGGGADVYCLLGRTGDGPGALGLTAFLVPARTPGLTTHPIAMIAPRDLANLVLDDCHVPDDAVLGRPGGGFPIAMDVLDRFRVTVGAAALGFARRAADAALARARQRPIYGGRLFDLDTVKAGLADIEVKLNAAALLVARGAWELDQGSRRAAKHSSIAKLYATEAAQQIVDACVQLYGAAGLVAGSLPERLYRQVRALRIYEGASEVQRAVIAGALDVRRADLLGRQAPDPPAGLPVPSSATLRSIE